MLRALPYPSTSLSDVPTGSIHDALHIPCFANSSSPTICHNTVPKKHPSTAATDPYGSCSAATDPYSPRSAGCCGCPRDDPRLRHGLRHGRGSDRDSDRGWRGEQGPGGQGHGQGTRQQDPGPKPRLGLPLSPHRLLHCKQSGTHKKTQTSPGGGARAGTHASGLGACMVHPGSWDAQHTHTRRTTQREDSKTCVCVHVSSHTCDLRNSWIGWDREACLWIGCARRGVGAGNMGGHAGCTRVMQACDAGMACARLVAWTHMHSQAQPIDISHPLSPHHDATAPSTDGWVQS